MSGTGSSSCEDRPGGGRWARHSWLAVAVAGPAGGCAAGLCSVFGTSSTVFSPGTPEHDHPRIARQAGLSDVLKRFCCGRAVALEIVGEVTGVSQELVVLVQTVGDAAESAEGLQPADDRGFNRVAGSFEFRGRGPRLLKGVDLFVDLFLQLLPA